MPLKRQHYTLALNGPEGVTEHVVDVGPGDHLRAELEGKKRGMLPRGVQEHQVVFTSLCVYFAAVRAKLTEADFDTFIHTDCYEYEGVKDEAGEPLQEPVDPTSSAAPSESASPSHAGTEAASTTG